MRHRLIFTIDQMDQLKCVEKIMRYCGQNVDLQAGFIFAYAL